MALSLASGAACAQAPAAFLDPTLKPEARAAALVSAMTLEEKAGQLKHAAPAIPRLSVPAYNWWSEGLHGVAAEKQRPAAAEGRARPDRGDWSQRR
ncbi:hypothetical protein [Caulobacter sp. Root1472]|uniref:hypothetical protein n=1 Tax=Caulobacter sp. Root1472 TaxID=1736470 RepID=UPI0006FC92B8|nr:hypothetical protein [Caulobacter sp. Root1472]KQZ30840.1 hypothetical protein ASD47_18130 [Caulobacter sp. Root1472]